MKKYAIFFIIAFAIVPLLAHSDFMQPSPSSLKIDADSKIIVQSHLRDLDLPPAPSYTFDIDPVDLGGTIYDYMPGSYCGLPIVVQSSETGGGVYMVYQARRNATSNRRVYYSYIDANGSLTAGTIIASDDKWEGYPGTDIDAETGDPIAAWHLDANDNGLLDNNMSWDNFHLNSFPVSWLDPGYTVIDNAQLAEEGIIQNGDDFILPYTRISTSPQDGMRRVYISATNYVSNVPGAPENVLIAYADFSTEDLTNQMPASWDWHYRTVQQFDDWHNETTGLARVMKTFIVHDNYVVYIGELIYNIDSANTPKLFALVNDNYGEGDFDYYEFDYQNEWPISDVQNQGDSWLYGDLEPAQLKWDMFASGHLNAIFTDNQTISFTGALVVEFLDSQDDVWSYRPDYGQMCVKEFTFDIATGSFGVVDVYPPDLSDSENNTPVVPWDLDGDGEVDQYDADGFPEWVPSIPVFHTNLDNAFHYASIKITQSADHNYKAMVWNDCYEAYLQSIGVEGYDDWAKTSKIMISLKLFDQPWSTPIVMNAKENDENYAPELDGMIPSYVYPADKITDINWYPEGKLGIFFLNDDSYGSSIQQEGATPDPNLCRLEYAAIRFVGCNADDNDIQQANLIDASNYPNPFNPTTTIKYNVPESGNVTVEIYNVLGQKVRTLVSTIQRAGENSIIWDGTNNNGDVVASGVYFYKLTVGGRMITKKMILMK